jgi:FtsP/CotA-like multicopper oxidase with cupredoxin domain
MPKLEELVPYSDDLPPQKPNPYDLRGNGAEVELTITLKYADDIVYSGQLGKTGAWTYEGIVPGPTIVVDQAQTVHVRWLNNIGEKETLPYKVVVFPDASPSDAVADPPPPTSSCSCSPLPTRVQLHPPQNEAGASGGVINPQASALKAAIVTHLHGGLTAPDSDGWAENVYPSGRSQFATYGKAGLPDGKEQRGTLLWYHDHGMGVTRLNVYAGLFGLWVLRDPAEYQAIKGGVLPGEEDELFLVIQDRNFAADKDGNLTGELLHKTETSTAEMFGPCTLVNGKLWPTCNVPARPVRLRILNGSNSRTYCLRIVHVERKPADPTRPKYSPINAANPLPVWQVGTDGGLLYKPVDLSEPSPTANLVLAPAERADLVVDFSNSANQTLAFVNTAFAPFHGSTVTNPNRYNVDGSSPAEPDQTILNPPVQDDKKVPSTVQPDAPGTAANLEMYLPFRLRFPHVLRFVVGPADKGKPSKKAPKRLTADTIIDGAFKRYVHSAGDSGDPGHEVVLPANHNHRWIALAENPIGNLTFRELVPYTTDPDVAAAAPADMPLIPISALNGVVTWYQTVAKAFHDPVRFFIQAGGCEVWNILNLTGDTHPVHVHLVQFQILTRQRCNAASFQTPPAPASGPATPIKPTEAPRSPDAIETGFKDTVRANPGEVVQIAAMFEAYCGKYMYHCHILEHEDHDMMRPFVVVAPDAFAMMSAEMGDRMTGQGGMKM